MLLVKLSVIASVYLGARLFERYTEKKSLTDSNMALQSLEKTPSSQAKEKRSRHQAMTLESVIENRAVEEIEKGHDHHFKVSAVTMGLAVVRPFYPALTLLSIGMIVYSVYPIMKQTENSLLKERRIKNDLITAVVSVMSLAMGQYFASALQAWSYHFAIKMMSKSKDISTQMLTNVFEQQPSNVWILKDHLEVEVPLEALQIDDIVVVKAGEVVPVDGVIIEGMAMIDQQALTGEAVPAEKGLGDNVFAATLVVRGRIQVKVEKTGLETTISELGEILDNTAYFKTGLQLKGEEWSNKVAMPLLATGLVSAPFLGVSSATSMLFSAPTNTVEILTSLHTFNHLTLVSKKGILIKDGRALEELTKIDTVLFDKTGTLTKEEPEVGQIVVCDELGEDEILVYAASAEHRLTHPIAQAIVKQAQKRHLGLFDIEEANYKIGYGVTVHLKNQVIKVGSARFMSLEGIDLPHKIAEAKLLGEEEGYSLVMVAINQQLQGAIEIRPQVRPEVKKIIAGLRQQGIQHIAIVSGDQKRPTQKLAEALGMDNYFYEVLPQNKADLVEQLQQEGRRVCFVGDGINDAIAMKMANVSISLRGAASVATDMAQVVLMDGSLSHLCEIFEISKKLNVNLRNTLVFWAGYGVINIAANTFLQVGILKSTIFYSLFLGLGIEQAMLPLGQLGQGEKKKAWARALDFKTKPLRPVTA
jgi:heavy metal translocating P-type ATPase